MTRFARIRADRVEVGHKLLRLRGGDPAEVVGRELPNFPAEGVRLFYADGSRGYYDAGHRLSVEDDSGLIQLRENVEVYGPYVTSCTMDPVRSGSIHFTNVRCSGRYVVKCDLLIRQDDQTVIRLDSVELNHIRDMAVELIERARAAEHV